MLRARLVDDAPLGYRWGVAQPGAYVIVELAPAAIDLDDDRLRAAAAELALEVDAIGVINAGSLAALPNRGRAAATALARCVLAVQRQQRVPVATGFALHAEQAPRGGDATRWRAVLPVIDERALRVALGWAEGFVGGLLQMDERDSDDRSEGMAERVFEHVSERVPEHVSERCSERVSERLAERRARHAEAVAALRALRVASQNYGPMIDACVELGIPVVDPSPTALHLGLGADAIQFRSTISSHTSAIGVNLVRSKHRTARRLREAGMPAPINALARDAEHAVAIAGSIGWPVVVKPDDQERGLGVAADIVDAGMVRHADALARRHSNAVVVEKHVAGHGHRLTVFRHSVLRVRKKLAAGVVGDGVQTVNALLAALNAERARRGDPDGVERAPIELDDEALGLLAQHGLTPEAIPEAGRFVALRRRNNASAGGSSQTIPPAEVHPDNLALAVRAARLFGLDFAGIDLIIDDIGQSWLTREAGICDVNAQPQIDHITLKEILAALPLAAGRVPLHLIVADEPSLAEAQRRAAAAARSLGCNVHASTLGLFIDGQRVAPALASGHAAARALLLCPELRAGLCVLSLDEVRRHGLPVRHAETLRIVLHRAPGDGEVRAKQRLGEAVAQLTPHAGQLQVRIGFGPRARAA